MYVGRVYYSIIFRTEAREEEGREREGVAERERQKGRKRKEIPKEGRKEKDEKEGRLILSSSIKYVIQLCSHPATPF